MTTPTTNLGLSSIQTEFTGAAPIALTEYYKSPGGAYVPVDTVTSAVDGSPIPTSGTIRMGMFRGVSRRYYPTGAALITQIGTQTGNTDDRSAFTFYPDGTIVTEGNQCIASTNWFFPTTAGHGNNLWIQVSRISGAYPPDPLNPVSLSVARTWHRRNETGCARVWIATQSSMLAQYRLSETIFKFFANATPPASCP